jgi:Flp pilus assembly protein TadD
MLPVRLIIVLSVLVLAACANQALSQKPTVAVDAENLEERMRLEKNIPNVELSADILYQILLAEISGQRGQLGLSVRAYLEAAKTTRDPRIAQRATEIALYAREQAAAFQAVKIWLDADPKSLPAKQTIVALLINNGDLQSATPYLKELLSEEKKNIAATLLQLNRLLEKHPDKNSVVILTQELVQPFIAYPEAHYIIARAAYDAEQNELALKEVGVAQKLRQNWEAAALLQGQILQRSSNASAMAYWKQYLERYPKARELRLSYARLLVAEKQHALAREQFQKLTDEFPDNAEVMLATAALSMQLKDWDIAERQLNRVLDLNYRDPDTVRYYLGQINEERGSYVDAMRWYASVSRGEQVFAARIGYAESMAKSGELEKARHYLQQITPQDERQRVALAQTEAQLLRDRMLYKEAFAVLEQALKKMPNSMELLYDYAMAAEKLDHLDVLEENLRRILQIKPDHAHALNALGYTLADRTDRLQEAAALIEQALQLSPQDPFILDSMGWVQYRLGNQVQALDYLRRAFATRADPEIAAHLGEVLWSQGDQREAQTIWRNSLKDHPHNEVLQSVIKKFVP